MKRVTTTYHRVAFMSNLLNVCCEYLYLKINSISFILRKDNDKRTKRVGVLVIT